MIPTTIMVAGAATNAVWWVDLIVAPEHRGHGLQNLFDREVLSLSSLKLGFPNALAARIHRRHGWGVREDLCSLLLPFRPRQIRAFRENAVGRLAATAIEPLAAVLRRRYSRTHGMARNVESTDQPDVDRLTRLAERLPATLATTQRSAEHLHWRYACGPDAQRHRYYIAKDTNDLDSVALITKTFDDGCGTVVRVLDLFGDVDDRDSLRSAVQSALLDAASVGAKQVVVLTSCASLRRRFQRLGFLLGARSRFCWHTEDKQIFQALAGPTHWVLGDSDNDAPA